MSNFRILAWALFAMGTYQAWAGHDGPATYSAASACFWMLVARKS